MSKLTLSAISAAVDAAYATALAGSPAVRVPAQSLGDNATLRTDLYVGSAGSGFVVVATVDLKYRTLTISRQHGPETWREHAPTTLASLVTECQRLRAAAYADPANACSVYDLADAETKLASSDATVQAQGTTQRAAVLAARLAIKAKYPKPE